jgi:IS4 transposase
VLRKFFPRDKNYVLERTQLSMESALLQHLVDYVKVEYLLRYNPLGIADATTDRIQKHSSTEYDHLHEFYLNLAGVFRFKNYSDNQLEFLFDGRDPAIRYREEWETTFRLWVKEFCRHENFIKAVLELTVFYPEDYTPQMAGLRLSTFITRFFDLKIDGQKGIVRIKVA